MLYMQYSSLLRSTLNFVLCWRASSNLEPVSGHTSLVLLNQRLTLCLRGIIGFGEEHAIIPRGFFFFADAAWLELNVSCAQSLLLLSAFVWSKVVEVKVEERTLGFSTGLGVGV